MIVRRLVLCAFFFALLSGGGVPPESRAQILEQTFTENLAEFRISTPNANWYFVPRRTAPGPLRATIRFKFPVDKFVPNATVRVVALADKKLKLKKMIEQDLSNLPSNIELKSKKPIKHLGLAGYEVQMLDKNSETTFLQWTFLSKGKSFVITCAAKSSTYSRFEEEFKKILNSFEIR